MLQLRLLHSIFKASLSRHTLKNMTKLLIKLSRIYASYYVPKISRNFFHHLRKSFVLQNSSLNIKSSKYENETHFINVTGTSIHANKLKLENLYKYAYFQGLFSTFVKTVGWKTSNSMTNRNQINQFASATKFR